MNSINTINTINKENTMNKTYEIKDRGRNGSATLTQKGIERVLPRRIVADQIDFIPWANVQRVFLDSRWLSCDQIEVHLISGEVFVWRCKEAKQMLDFYMALSIN